MGDTDAGAGPSVESKPGPDVSEFLCPPRQDIPRV